MLHRAAVPLNLLAVLLGLQQKTATAGFALAGGTSLALRFGHRLSVDLDFFTTSPFEAPDLAHYLGVGPESITGQAAGSLQLRINQVKVEFLKHAYPKLTGDEHLEGVTLYSLEDVAAMTNGDGVNRLRQTGAVWGLARSCVGQRSQQRVMERHRESWQQKGFL